MASTETFKRLTVDSVMHVGIIECEPQATLEDAARLMAEEGTHSVVVYRLAPGSHNDEERGWGIVSDVDLMRAVGAGGLRTKASEAAANEIVTIGIHESLERAAQVMAEHECSHLIVTAHT
jgi:CBS domain-containing protein